MVLRRALMMIALCAFFGTALFDVGRVQAASLDVRDLTTQQDTVVIVEKSVNKMTVFYQGKALKSFTVVSGVNDQGDKQRQGDNRTPEGRFFITEKERLNDHPYLGKKWLGLSYPDPVHAQRGVENNLININQYREIVRANEQKVQPPQNTALGGWIGIHGGREDLTKARINWTEGCLALQDADLEELYRLVDYGTPVVILA